jgi:hypothetical protein
MRTVFNKIELDRLETSQFGKLQAWLRQDVETFYPSEAINGGHDELISFEGSEEQSFTSTRTAFVSLPNGTTKEAVEAKLTANPNAHISRILSFRPIITEGDEAQNRDEEMKSENQAVRDSNGHLVLSEGKVQFHRFFFKMTGVAGSDDVDQRPETKDNVYVPMWFSAEQSIAANAPAVAATVEETDVPF